MVQPLIRQGEGPAAAYLRHHELRAEQAKLLAAILLETGEPKPKQTRNRRGGKMIGFRSAEDDLARLRALPCVAPGVAGAIPGTDPARALLAKERGRRR